MLPIPMLPRMPPSQGCPDNGNVRAHPQKKAANRESAKLADVRLHKLPLHSIVRPGETRLDRDFSD